MNTNIHFFLAATLMVALWQPAGLLGRDQDQGTSGAVQGQGHHGSSGGHEGASHAAHAQSQVPAGARFSGHPAGHASVLSPSTAHFSGAGVYSGKGAFQPSGVSHYRARTTDAGHQRNWGTTGSRIVPPAALSSSTGTNVSRRSYQTFSGNRHFNQGNNYGGHWYPAHTHANWDRGREHYWHGHHYRWYNDGWLIIDGGFWPYDYGYPYYGYDDYYPGVVYQPSYVSDYYDATVVATDVQSALADMGYYRGPIDGIIGPMTRQAIEDYQRDRGLVVSGRINRALLESLGLR
jgi:hypothetical protein